MRYKTLRSFFPFDDDPNFGTCDQDGSCVLESHMAVSWDFKRWIVVTPASNAGTRTVSAISQLQPASGNCAAKSWSVILSDLGLSYPSGSAYGDAHRQVEAQACAKCACAVTLARTVPNAIRVTRTALGTLLLNLGVSELATMSGEYKETMGSLLHSVNLTQWDVQTPQVCVSALA